MLKVLGIIAAVAVVFGIGAYIFSDKGDPKERAADAAGAAMAGGAMAGGCLLQCVMAAVPIIIGFLIIKWIFF